MSKDTGANARPSSNDEAEPKPTRWIKVPGPGQYRGEGDWQIWEDSTLCDDDWGWCQHMFPTHEGEKPECPR